MIALLLALGCATPDDGDKDEGDDVVVACPEGVDAVAEATDMPTVLRVRWTTTTATRGRVVYGNGDGLERATAWETGLTTDHEALLVGLLPEAEIAWRVETEGDAAAGCEGVATTGALPAGLPDLEVGSLDAKRDGGGLTVVPVFTEDQNWIAVLDEAGRYVWADAPVDGGGLAHTLFRAAVTRDGSAIAWNLQAATAELPGIVGRTRLDGTPLDPIEVLGAHTDFVELDGGRWATLGWEIRTVEGRKFLGDTVLVVEADGGVRKLWTVWDHFAPDLGREWQKGFYQGDPEVEDWTHVNGIAWDPASGDLLLTATFIEGVLRVDGATGALEWTLSDHEGDFAIGPDDRPLVELPHSVQDLGGDRLLVFNRGNPQDPTSCSEAQEIQLDRAAGTATGGWSWAPEDCVFVAFLGQARRLQGGNTVLDLCSAGRIDEVTPEGELVARFELSAGAAFGYSDHMDAPR